MKKNAEACEITYVDEKKVKKVQREMLREKAVETISDMFKALGDYTRLKILYALSKEELCVRDLSSLLETSISAISHQLRVLRNLRLVKPRRQGKVVYYSLDDDHVLSLLQIGVKHAEES
ncbi:MAG: winged helix-turn-helix transcriptional regulator [archaeon]|nr:winged helix-turn-helix transcriptional regulator [archaeon]MCP8305645.1 winged helix-turn-helix transcriptional regulator [archaeon]